MQQTLSTRGPDLKMNLSKHAEEDVLQAAQQPQDNRRR
jgi:hypothetical protein